MSRNPSTLIQNHLDEIASNKFNPANAKQLYEKRESVVEYVILNFENFSSYDKPHVYVLLFRLLTRRDLVRVLIERLNFEMDTNSLKLIYVQLKKFMDANDESLKTLISKVQPRSSFAQSIVEKLK